MRRAHGEAHVTRHVELARQMAQACKFEVVAIPVTASLTGSLTVSTVADHDQHRIDPVLLAQHRARQDDGVDAVAWGHRTHGRAGAQDHEARWRNVETQARRARGGQAHGAQAKRTR